MFKIIGNIFILHPYFALIPALIFSIFYLKSKNKITLITVSLWILYGIYEELNLLRITCSGECNIRIDLFLIYPLLVALSITSLFIDFKKLIKDKNIS